MNRILLILMIFVSAGTAQAQNGELRRIELGISYDQNYIDAFSSEDDAIDMIYTLILDNVNCLYEPYNVLFIPIVHIKTNLNSSDRRELRISASNFWNKRVDACLRPDMVHHLTGIGGLAGVLGEAGGGKKALCGIGTSNSAICSVSEFSWDIFKAGVAIAHELGHHLGMSHENNQSSLMYENPVLQTCDNVLSSHNVTNLNNLLNSASCVNVVNNSVDPYCSSCDKYVTMTNHAERLHDFKFGCEKIYKDSIIDLTTVLSNNCINDNHYWIAITYDSNDVDIVEISDNFKAKEPYNGLTTNAIIRSDTTLLKKGESDYSVLKIKIKGNGRYPQDLSGQTGTNVYITYYLDKTTNIKDTYKNIKYDNTNTLSVDFIFKYPYQMDRRGIPIVKASELKVPDNIDSLDFCYGKIPKDIYIDGDFIIDINQSYCNANFYFGPNAKVIVQKNKKLKLSSCILTACAGRWQGIYLEAGAALETDDNTAIHHAITAIEGDRAKVTLKKTDFEDNITAVKLTNSTILPSEDIHIKDGTYGMMLTLCRRVELKNVDIRNVKSRGIKAENTFLILTNCKITGTSKSASGYGIESTGTGHVLSITGESEVSNWQVGINCLRNTMIINDAKFENNFIGITQTNSQGFSHTFFNNTFSNCDYGFTTTNSTPIFTSYIEENTFNNVKYGISISNSTNHLAGWGIGKCNFTNSGAAGIRLRSASGNNISGCNMQSTGLPNSTLISASGGSINNIFNNYLTCGSGMTPESNQVKGIEIKGVTGISLSCNEAEGGTYAYNYWGMSPGHFAGNISRNTHTGLYCGLYPSDGNALMGVQEHYFNKWYSSSMSVGAKHLGTNNFYIQRSQFIVTDDPNQGIYWPDPIIPNNKEWFVKRSTLLTPRDCEASAPGNEDPPQRPGVESDAKRMYTAARDYLMEADAATESTPQTGVVTAANTTRYIMDSALVSRIIQKAIPFESYKQEQDAGSIWQLYQLVQADPAGYSTCPGIEAFMTAYAPTLGVLYEAARTISGVGHYAVSGQRSHARVSSADYSLVAASADSLTAAIYATEQVQHHQDIHAALTALQSLILTEAPWQHQQALLTVLGRWMLTDSLSGADISTLSWIAGACPLYGGEAVYGARAALETVAGEAHYDDHALCQQVHQRSSGAAGVTTLTVAPNPASEGIRVSGSHIALVRLMTATGSVVQEIRTGDVAEVDIDTSLLSPGIYLVSVTHGEANTTEIKKLIILR